MGDESRSADDVWLDAMESRDLADHEKFIELRTKTLEIDPHHEDALMSEIRDLFRYTGPRGDRPTKMSLQEAAKGLQKCKPTTKIMKLITFRKLFVGRLS